MTDRLPTFFLSHGAGPWPYMTGEIRERFASLEAFLKELPRQIGVKPKAVLAVSGHWEEKDFAVMASPSPPMIFDFGRLPKELSTIRYPAPGFPELAKRIASLIQRAGLACHLDPVRGFDHGAYSPLAVMYPEADIPVVQVSIRSDYDPAAHLKLGHALAPLREEGVLIIGSGSSYYNLPAIHGKSEPREASAEFDIWLKDTLVDAEAEQREERLLKWESAPHARAVHPQEDHFIPLHVAVGAAEGEPGQIVYQNDFYGRFALSSYRFGAIS